MSSTAALNAASFAEEGLVNPLILRTNCSEAARISSSVAGGSKLKSGLMFLHIALYLQPARSARITQFSVGGVDSRHASRHKCEYLFCTYVKRI
jgi:hypothetical protein